MELKARIQSAAQVLSDAVGDRDWPLCRNRRPVVSSIRRISAA